MGKVCEVSPYTDEYDAITDVPVVRGATLWTDQHTNNEYILVFNEACGWVIPSHITNQPQPTTCIWHVTSRQSLPYRSIGD